MAKEEEDGEFEFRKKIENWVEGLIDVAQIYLATVFRLHLRPFRSLKAFIATSDAPEFSAPSTYFVLSYIVMCLLIRDVDFSDPVFSTDIAARLGALGVLDAVKSIKVETLVASLFPALLILLFFILTASAFLGACGDPLEARLIRRNYSYSLGSAFLLLGAVSGGYHYAVKPLASVSWWLGLPVHMLTLWPLAAVLGPMLAIQYLGRPAGRRILLRWVALMIPLVGMSLILRLTLGTFSLMDYTRVR